MQATFSTSVRQPCVPGSSERRAPSAVVSVPVSVGANLRPVHAWRVSSMSEIQRSMQPVASSSSHSPSGNSSNGAGSMASNSLSLKKFRKALEASRQRLQSSSLMPTARAPALPAPPTSSSSSSTFPQPKSVESSSPLVQEFQTLVAQLRQLDELPAPPAPVAPRTVHRATATAIAPPLLERAAPEYAPRAYTARAQVLVCQGKKCAAAGAAGVLQAVEAVTAGADRVDVVPCKCLGKCKAAAAMRIKGPRGDVLLTEVTPQSVGAALDAQLLGDI